MSTFYKTFSRKKQQVYKAKMLIYNGIINKLTIGEREEMSDLTLVRPSIDYAWPEPKTAVLLAKEKINILEVHSIPCGENHDAFQFQVEFYFEPGNNQKPRWVKMPISACGRDFEVCVQWVIYRVWQTRQLYEQYLTHPSEVDLETWE